MKTLQKNGPIQFGCLDTYEYPMPLMGIAFR